MKYWIVPSSDKYYLVDKALEYNNGFIDWRQKRNKFAVGDIVFIYNSYPDHKLKFKMEVLQVNIDERDKISHKQFWADLDAYNQGLGGYCVRFKLIEKFDDDRFSLINLRNHGLKGNPQSPMHPAGELLDYILNSSAEEQYPVDYPEDDSILYEGALVKVKANRYERNRDARQKCLDVKGYRCAICGFDFEETYGSIGKHFIEVHHIVPISSIGKDYKIKPEDDLVPVCSNCHSMLHQKPGKYEVYTIEELQQKMKEAKVK